MIILEGKGITVGWGRWLFIYRVQLQTLDSNNIQHGGNKEMTKH